MAVLGLRFLCEGFLQLRQAGATLHRGAWASHYRGLSPCGAQAPDAQAQQLWLMGAAAPRHAGSSQTRARTHVPRIGRQTLNHCATREAHTILNLMCLLMWLSLDLLPCYLFSICHIYYLFPVMVKFSLQTWLGSGAPLFGKTAA